MYLHLIGQQQTIRPIRAICFWILPQENHINSCKTSRHRHGRGQRYRTLHRHRLLSRHRMHWMSLTISAECLSIRLPRHMMWGIYGSPAQVGISLLARQPRQPISSTIRPIGANCTSTRMTHMHPINMQS